MPERYWSDRSTLGSLLSLTSPTICVPEWQRSYSWDTRQVETFWQDLIAFSDRYPAGNIDDEEYFLGSIVIVAAGDSHLLLDGQQRLATATILLSVMRDRLADFNQDAATRTQLRYISDYNDATEQLTRKLTMNHYDQSFFRQEIQDFPRTAEPRPELASHRLIRSARGFFNQEFQIHYDNLGGGRAAFDWCLRIQQVLINHMSVVAVKTRDEDNASEVFETLNDRGIGLSTPDLVRILLMRRANDDVRGQVNEYWRLILEVEEDAKVQNFLRHYWLSHNGDVKTHSLYRAIKSNVIDNDVNSLEFSQDLSETAAEYREIVAARSDDPALKRLLEALSALGANSLLPAVMSAYDEDDAESRIQFISSLITLYVRHNVIGGLENSKLENVVFTVAKELRVTHDFAAMIVRLKDFAPNDERFKEQFGEVQISRTKSARYILEQLEHSKRLTQEVRVEGPERVHVEHIYPKTPEGDPWDNHAAIIDRLGNLTLLARRLNLRIRNGNFQRKKEEYRNSDLLLARELLEFDDWNLETINERQNELAEHALNIWNFPA